ncbi:hypothetical protein GCM10009745_62190 [Kribbella yunnanensis]|uniref:Uncharacterized protein n=1 Tax=Kribbella yunnanensis TaxID=190194 RepID=A0ABN2IJ41_9ACTN
MDASEQRIADSLTRHAADAPSDHDLLSTVHTRLRRRRTGQVVGTAVLAIAVVATGITAAQSTHTEPQPAPQPVPPAQAGWRWESYKTAQIQVPEVWQQHIAGPAPCAFMQKGKALVGRFYDWLPRDQYTCSNAVMPLSSRQPYVWFDDVQAPGVKQYDGGWSEETRLVGGTKVSVLAPNEQLRREILDTARPITSTDVYGCTPTDTRPAGGTPSRDVDGAEICQYARGSLIAGTHLPPRQAGQLALGLTKRPTDCDPSGEQRSYVITLHSGADSFTVRRQERPCVLSTPLGLDFLRDGALGPYDPSALFDPAGPVTPPVR